MTELKLNHFKSMERLRAAVEADPVARGALEHRSAVLNAARIIREMRLQAGLTQQELADLIRTQQPNIVRIERGEGTRGPTIDMLGRVAKACGQTLLVGWTSVETVKEVLKEGASAPAHLIAM